MLVPISRLKEPFTNEIDERNNPAYGQDPYYETNYGGLKGWTEFHAPQGSWISGYDKGNLSGSGFQSKKNSSVIAEFFAHSHSNQFWFIFNRGFHSFVDFDATCAPLELCEQELKNLGISENERNTYAYILGFSAYMRMLLLHFFLNKIQGEVAKSEQVLHVPVGGLNIPIKAVIDAENPNWDEFWRSIKYGCRREGLGDNIGEWALEWFEDFTDVVDVPWWKLISSISLVRWARKGGVDLSTEQNQIKALDELKKSLGSRDFEFLGGSMDSIYLDIDHTVVQELNDCKDLDIQTLLPKMLTTMDGRVNYDSFEACWLAGMTMGKAYVSWGLAAAKFVAEECFRPLFDSGFCETMTTLPVSIVLAQRMPKFDPLVLEEYEEYEDHPWHLILNPLHRLVPRSHFLRCLKANMTAVKIVRCEFNEMVFSQSQIGIILRLLDDGFCKNVQDSSNGSFAFDFGSFTEKERLLEQSRARSIQDIEEFLDQSKSGKMISGWIANGDIEKIVTTIAVAGVVEYECAQFLDAQFGGSRAKGWTDQSSLEEFCEECLERFRPDLTRNEGTLVSLIANFDGHIPAIYECIEQASKCAILMAEGD